MLDEAELINVQKIYQLLLRILMRKISMINKRTFLTDLEEIYFLGILKNDLEARVSNYYQFMNRRKKIILFQILLENKKVFGFKTIANLV